MGWERSFKQVVHNTKEDSDYHSDNGTAVLTVTNHTDSNFHANILQKSAKESGI